MDTKNKDKGIDIDKDKGIDLNKGMLKSKDRDKDKVSYLYRWGLFWKSRPRRPSSLDMMVMRKRSIVVITLKLPIIEWR